MRQILHHNIAPAIRNEAARTPVPLPVGDVPVVNLPAEPTREMIIAALEASIEFRKRCGIKNLEPWDEPGGASAEAVRVVWRAMLPLLLDTHAQAAKP